MVRARWHMRHMRPLVIGVLLLAVSPWEFGWEALVAVGTLLLALATFYLVLRTSALAKSSESDLRAQWRPVILPASYPSLGESVGYDANADLLFVRVQNAGRGPALHVRTQVEPGGISPDHWSLGSLAVGNEQELWFRTVKPDSTFQVLFDYRDLANRTYSTSMTVDIVDEAMRFYDVRLYEDHAVTPLGDAVYPQSGLRDVSPRVRPGWRERGRMVVLSLRGDLRSDS
jgi:hypothetical protein